MSTKMQELLWKEYSKESYKKVKMVLKDLECSYAIIKGEALSIQAYNVPGQRICSDVDILISVDNLQKLNYILVSHGFECKKNSRFERVLLLSNSHQLLPYIGKMPSPWPSMQIDINFDIFWGEYEGKRVNIEEFLQDAMEMDIYGTNVKVLSPIKAMIQLVLHHYKDMNSIYLLSTCNCIRDTMFKDVYHLLKNNIEAISIEKFYQICAEYQILPYVFYVFYYTEKVICDSILKKYIDAFRTKEGEEILNCYGLCKKERKEWRCNFETRLKTDNLLPFIKDDLTDTDRNKIHINKQIFGGKI